MIFVASKPVSGKSHGNVWEFEGDQVRKGKRVLSCGVLPRVLQYKQDAQHK